jgi:hypothetical protein
LQGGGNKILLKLICFSSKTEKTEKHGSQVNVTLGQLATIKDSVVRSMFAIGACQQQLLMSAKQLQSQNEILASAHAQIDAIITSRQEVRLARTSTRSPPRGEKRSR